MSNSFPATPLLDKPREVQLVGPDGARRTVTLRSRPGAGRRVLGEIAGVGSPEAAAAQPLCFGDCRLDLASRQLERDGVPVPITSGEFALLASFVQHPHRPLSRERLIELARGPGSETDSRSMDVQISRLRKLIEPDPARPRFVQTVWGYGYVFVPDGQPRTL
jgi:DNA-binding response OmpR family regulator